MEIASKNDLFCRERTAIKKSNCNSVELYKNKASQEFCVKMTIPDSTHMFHAFGYLSVELNHRKSEPLIAVLLL